MGFSSAGPTNLHSSYTPGTPRLTLSLKLFLLVPDPLLLKPNRKPKFCSDSVIKNPNRIRTVQKFDIRADGFPTETACNPANPQFKLKVAT